MYVILMVVLISAHPLHVITFGDHCKFTTTLVVIRAAPIDGIREFTVFNELVAVQQ